MSMMSGPTGVRSPSGRTGNKIPKGYELNQLQQYTPEQMNLFRQQFAHVGPESFLGKLAAGDQSQFAALEQPALRQFAGLQGNLASRFSGMGGTGARRSSGFQNTMTQANQDFAAQLQSNRMGLQQQAIQQLMGLSNQLLGQQPYEQFLTEKQKKTPWWQSLLAGLGPGIGQMGGQAAGNALFGGNQQPNSMGQAGAGGGGGPDIATLIKLGLMFV